MHPEYPFLSIGIETDKKIWGNKNRPDSKRYFLVHGTRQQKKNKKLAKKKKLKMG